MAKRSVKKARRQQPAAAAPAASPPPASGRRPFLLGVLAAAAVLLPLAVAAVLLLGDGGSDPEADEQAAVQASIEREAAELQRKTQVRDKEQVKELTDQMRGTAEELGSVLAGLDKALPPGERRPGPPARPAAVRDWAATVRRENEYFAETVSGETGTNVARGGFSASLDTLAGAVGTYELALQDAGARARLLRDAASQRDLAVRMWSVAATQLDAINIATGYGHQHVYLSGSEESGGFGADPAPEGSGAVDGDDHAGE